MATQSDPTGKPRPSKSLRKLKEEPDAIWSEYERLMGAKPAQPTLPRVVRESNAQLGRTHRTDDH